MADMEALQRLEEIDREIVLVSHISGVLEWDQEAVPPMGTEERSRQQGWLERKLHDLVASDEMGMTLAALGADDSHTEGADWLDDRSKGLVRLRYASWNRERKLDADFVQKFAETTGKAHHLWAKARKEDDFALYQPILTEIVTLVREKSQRYGYTDSPYDPLLDRFEPGTTTKEVSEVFGVMKSDLQALIDELKGRPQIDDSFLYLKYPEDKQALFGKEVLTAMGFDFNRGTTGISTHPFTTTIGSDDIRLTTRYTEPSITSPLFSTIHEGGHALYELGASNTITRGTSLASGTSLAMHESQSRLWENIIGRSRPFWDRFFPRLKELFPVQLEGVDIDRFLAAINRVEPSFIRVNADEVTYGLHIILRFELECALLQGTLEVRDLPHAWDEAMVELLGVRPKSARLGVLQDVHWSMGELGYFPTYALGNLYGAQINQTMRSQIDVDGLLESGRLAEITQWLDANIYRYGSIYRPKQLLEKVTGNPLDPRWFSKYLSEKYR